MTKTVGVILAELNLNLESGLPNLVDTSETFFFFKLYKIVLVLPNIKTGVILGGL